MDCHMSPRAGASPPCAAAPSPPLLQLSPTAAAAEQAEGRSRKSSRLARQLSVNSLGGGTTPHRRQEGEGGDDGGGWDTEPLPGGGAAAVLGKSVVTVDGRVGVVLSSGHGFFALRLDRKHGGGEMRVRGNQLQVNARPLTSRAASVASRWAAVSHRCRCVAGGAGASAQRCERG